MTVKKIFSKVLSTVVSLVLIAAMALMFTACDNTKTDSDIASSGQTQIADVNVVGEGNTEFSLKVTDKDGNSDFFTVKTDEKTVGAALQKVGLIEGENDQYGIFIKKVNGITADYDVDQTYWAFYIDGAYAQTGADQTEIETGASYEFKVEK